MKLPHTFYQRNTCTVAQNLLGCLLVSENKNVKSDEKTSGIIIETEAYLGEKDPGSHAFKGKTKRTQLMYGEAGRAYVYLCYGKYYLLNVVTEATGTPGAVLIRALEPVEGIETMKQRRSTQNTVGLTNGPGKLTQALGITIQHNGVDMAGSTLWIEPYTQVNAADIYTTRRIGVADEKLLRFFINRF